MNEERDTHVVLDAVEFHLAVLARLAPVGAKVARVVVVSEARDVLTAVQTARDRVVSARQQMSLLRCKQETINHGARHVFRVLFRNRARAFLNVIHHPPVAVHREICAGYATNFAFGTPIHRQVNQAFIEFN